MNKLCKAIISVLLTVFMILPILPVSLLTATAATTEYGLWLGEKQVTSANADNIFGDGKAKYDASSGTLTLNNPVIPGTHTNEMGSCKIYASKSDLTIKGSYQMTAAESEYGIMTLYSLTVNANLTILATDTALFVNKDLKIVSGTVNATGTSSRGIYSNDTITVTGGTVTATGGESYGMYGADGVTLSGGTITASSNYIGLCSNGTVKVGAKVKKVTLDASANHPAILTPDLIMQGDVQIAEPENATYLADHKSVYTVLDTTATIANHVVFMSVYPVWVGGVRVTYDNKDNVLGDGKVSYDPGRKALILNDPTIEDYFLMQDENGAITCTVFAQNIDLTVEGSLHQAEAYAAYTFLIYQGSLTLKGTFDLKAQIMAVFSNADLTVEGSLTASSRLCAAACDRFIVAGSSTRIDLTCESEGALNVACGNLGLSEAYYVAEPQNAVFKVRYLYAGGSAVPATHVVIAPALLYDLWVDGVRVTEPNRKDVLGDKKVSYDPASGTLTLNNAVIGTSYDSPLGSALIYAKDMDLKIEGTFSPDSTVSEYGVLISNGSLTLNGDLTFRGRSAGARADGGVRIEKGDVTITGSNYGVYTDGTLEVTSSVGTVTIEAGVSRPAVHASDVLLKKDYEAENVYIAEPANGVIDQTARRVVIKTNTCTYEGRKYIVLDNNTTLLSDAAYAVTSNMTIGSRMTVSGTVLLMLCDGVTLTVKGGIRLAPGNTLQIVAGSKGNGSLIIENVDGANAAIGGNLNEGCGTFIFSGGSLTARLSTDGAIIGGGRNGSGGRVAILGGRMVLGGESTRAIGAGNGGANHGTITFGEMCVFPYGSAYCVDWQYRENECTYKGAAIERCAHHYTDHVCDWCGKVETFADVFKGDGSAEDPYRISGGNDWIVFCDFVNTGMPTAGVYFLQTADLNGVYAMAGTGTYPFRGTYDGGGRILDFRVDNAPSLCAPFCCISDANIQNLRVTGEITTSNKFAAGIAAKVYGNCSITNCISEIVIYSNINGDGTHGGLLALPETGAVVTISGCVFHGAISGWQTTLCGGFVGYTRGDVYLTNCLFIPFYFDVTSSQNFSRYASAGLVHLTNCYYYHETAANDQGILTYGITVQGDYVSCSFGEKTSSYNVSGLDAYGSGLYYRGVFFTAPQTNIEMNFVFKKGMNTVSVYTNYGFTFNGSTASLAMPEKDVIIELIYGEEYNDFNFFGGDAGYVGEISEFLIDNDTSTKWCTTIANGPVSVTFTTAEAIIPSGYILTTANDTAKYPGRNPISWTLEGSADGTHWDLLTSEHNNWTMTARNFASFNFRLTVGPKKAYTYFRFTVTELQGGTTFQMSEIKLLAVDSLTGDLQNDGTVNIQDVTELLNLLESVPTDAGDLDCDGVTSITDVTALLNILRES